MFTIESFRLKVGKIGVSFSVEKLCRLVTREQVPHVHIEGYGESVRINLNDLEQMEGISWRRKNLRPAK